MTEHKRIKAHNRRKDYEKKRNIKQNNWPKNEYRASFPLSAGDGVLPKSRKYRDVPEKLSIKVKR